MRNPKQGAPRSARDVELSVADRLRVATRHLIGESPGRSPTIAEVCRTANVNRSNVYAHHRAVLDEILPTRRRLSKVEQAISGFPKSRELEKAARVEQYEAKYKALLIVCLELHAEIRSLRLRLDEQDAKTRRRTK